jgi:NADP-dependent 3-hydroxy acid dehydrogenase YdfG
MLLEHKVAVIYGAGGSIGGAVARAFAREGQTFSSPVAPRRISTRLLRRSARMAAQQKPPSSMRSTNARLTRMLIRWPSRPARLISHLT